VTGRADVLLSGPRGRRLCLELVLESAPAARGRADSGSLADAVGALDLPALAATRDPADLLPALQRSVDEARYWQEPDDDDLRLADPQVAAALRPVAEAVAAAAASRWWTEPMAAGDQHVVAWVLDDPADLDPPDTTGAAAALRRWRDGAGAEERGARRDRPADPRAAVSGTWWSTPALAGRPVTSRTVPGIQQGGLPAPSQLSLVEDHMGWRTARSWPARVPPTARVVELAGPADWAVLAQRYPFEVSASRRHDWWRISGWDGAWVVPDWSAVAADADAVHLTVDGYLSTAGRALPVDVPALGPARTLLAGWDPGATWWLTDVLAGLGEPTDWHREHQDASWTPAGR
jgi:hypothetical protein